MAARCLLRGRFMDERAERLSLALATVFRGMYRRMVIPAGPLYRLPLPSIRKFDRALADLHALVDEIIAERRASGQKPDDLLTALLEAKDDDGDPIDEQEIHDQVVAILTPGSETIASTIMWLLQVLAEQPEQADKVAAEVQSVVGDRPVGFADVRKLSHTNNVVVEAMRLRPAVWILTRRAVTETELGGYRIPAGADIVYSPLRHPARSPVVRREPGFRPRPLASGTLQGHPEVRDAPVQRGQPQVPQRPLLDGATHPRHRDRGLPLALRQVAGSNDATRVGITLRPQNLRLKADPR